MSTDLSYKPHFICSIHILDLKTLRRTTVSTETFEGSAQHLINGLVRFPLLLFFLLKDILVMTINLLPKSVNFILFPIPNLSRIFSKGYKNLKEDMIKSRSLSQEFRRLREVASKSILR